MDINFTKDPMKENILLYQNLFKKHGYSPKSLGCDKGKQFLHYHQLSSEWNLEGSSILDVGCGFGDFNRYLKFLKISNYIYTGIDIMNEFISQGNRLYSAPNVTFLTGDFLSYEFNQSFDYAIASGTFNLKIESIDGYDYIFKNMAKMFKLSKKAISIDFLSDKVDYSYKHNFNSSPEKILSMAYSLSKNIILKNNYFPYEFAVIVYKNDSFKKETTVFSEVEKKLEWLGI